MTQQHAAHESGGYDKQDVSIRRLVLISVMCMVVIVVASIWVRSYFIQVTEETIYEMVLKPGSLSLQELRTREDDVLNNYRIIDSTKGIYQIPIDSAMAIVAREAATRLTKP